MCPRTVRTAGGVAPKAATFGATGTLPRFTACLPRRQRLHSVPHRKGSDVTDDYLALIENAHEALRALLKASEPGTGLELHNAYASLTVRLETRKTLAVQRYEDSAVEREWAEHRARCAMWTQLPQVEKLHRVLNAIGDAGLTLRELTAKIKENHPELYVYESYFRGLVKELVEQGDLDRVKESRTPGGSQYRWRYHRHVELDPALAALENEVNR